MKLSDELRNQLSNYIVANLFFLREVGYIAVKSDKAGRTEHFVRFTDR